jgi:hypothetical protein
MRMGRATLTGSPGGGSEPELGNVVVPRNGEQAARVDRNERRPGHIGREAPMEGSTMRIVAGLFQSRGIAEDARNRLRSEGVPDDKLAVKTLKETGPLPDTVKSELAALSLDPLLFGDVRRSFVDHIRNGETVVLVGVASPAENDLAQDTLNQYGPIAMEVFEA